MLHVGSLMELVESGRSECQSQGMAAFLRPLISRGELQVVAECTAAELSLIERRDPAVLQAFVQLSVPEPPQPDRLRIPAEVARRNSSAPGPVFLPQPSQRSNVCTVASQPTPLSPRGS